jgi:ATP-dependent DNA ligase
MTNFEVPIIDQTEEPRKSSRRTGIMLCYPFEEKRLKTWSPPYLIQPKLDGVRCRAMCSHKSVVLLSSEGHIIDGLPHLNKAVSAMLPEEAILELDGELYRHGMNFQDITKRTSRTKNYHPDAESIQYHIFDIVESRPQIHRTSALNKLGFFKTSEAIQIVPSYLVNNLEEVLERFHSFIDSGYEGFVIRDISSGYARKRFTGIMKFKPHQKDIYTIVGVKEEFSLLGEPKGTLGAFTCSSQNGETFDVGSGLSADQRVFYWQNKEKLIGKRLRVKYQSLTPGRNVPRFPTVLEVIE